MIPANSNPAALPIPKLKLLNWKVIIPIINPMIKSAEGEQVRHLTMNRNKTNAIGDGFTRLASPLTCNTSPLFSTTLSSIGISIWLRMTRLRKQP